MNIGDESAGADIGAVLPADALKANAGIVVNAAHDPTTVPEVPTVATVGDAQVSAYNNTVVRTTPRDGGPWCWAEKGALRLITERCGENGTSPTVRSVYIALCELASDSQNEDFTAAKALIASKAGVSIKTAERALKDLAALGLVGIESRAGLRLPNNYQLLSMRLHDASMRHGLKQWQMTDKVEETEKKKQEPSAPQRRADKKSFRRAGAGAPRGGDTTTLPENCDF